MQLAAQNESSVSQTLQCGKCNQFIVSYIQAQTRSADEPMTPFLRVA
jgi:transcription elongation factor S-II